MTWIGRSEKWAHSRTHRGLSDRRSVRAAADPAGPPEDIATGDRLGGLTYAHIVGQQELTRLEEPFDAVALVGVQRALQSLHRGFLL